MPRYVRETAAGKSISAWVIFKAGKEVATVQAHYGSGGAVTVNIFQRDSAAKRSEAASGRSEAASGRKDLRFQAATTGGYGYDKLTAALSGLWIDGHQLTNHCEDSMNPPRGMKYFPADYKPRKGYRLANYGQFDRATGERIESYRWRELATAELGETAEWETIKARTRELENAADTVGGYSSCYRVEGFNYLQAIGYTVIQAI